MNKAQRETIENLIKRLEKPRAGCASPRPFNDIPDTLPGGYEPISRIYIDTWLIAPLKLALADDAYNNRLGRDMSR